MLNWQLALVICIVRLVLQMVKNYLLMVKNTLPPTKTRHYCFWLLSLLFLVVAIQSNRR